MKERSTIAALATAPAPAGIAVVRVSGPLARKAIKAIFKAKRDATEDPRRLIYGHLIDYRDGTLIDKALTVYMPGPHSFTGEDIAEFQFHGSPLLVQRVLRSLFAFGVSPADPGEFTQRAFLNGKLDLIQAEAIADLINASSEQALKIAGEQLDGKLSRALTEIGEPLRDTIAEIEATIDFPEEEISPEKIPQIKERIQATRQRLNALIQSYSYGQVLKEGFRVLLCGRPNVGKSSLLNALVGQERAIVTEISGTTRDLIEVEASFAGYRFIFCDSAGITETNDPVELIGIGLARERMDWADLVILVVDATDPSNQHQIILDEIRAKGKAIWMLINKIDLNPKAIGAIVCDSNICARNFYLSATTKQGFTGLIEALKEEVASRAQDSGNSSVVLTNERQRQCLERAVATLDAALVAIAAKNPEEIIAEDIRHTLSELEEIVGKTYTEDILGRIFSKFCIGK
jgi:tRNA modification GTPase